VCPIIMIKHTTKDHFCIIFKIALFTKNSKKFQFITLKMCDKLKHENKNKKHTKAEIITNHSSTTLLLFLVLHIVYIIISKYYYYYHTWWQYTKVLIVYTHTPTLLSRYFHFSLRLKGKKQVLSVSVRYYFFKKKGKALFFKFQRE